MYEGQLSKRSYEIQLAATQKASKVLVNGQKAKFTYNSENRINEIPISDKDIRSLTTVVIILSGVN